MGMIWWEGGQRTQGISEKGKIRQTRKIMGR